MRCIELDGLRSKRRPAKRPGRLNHIWTLHIASIAIGEPLVKQKESVPNGNTTTYGERESSGLLEDWYFINNLMTCVRNGWFDGQHEIALYQHVGFTLGIVQGGVLSPQTGKLRPDATTLLKLHNTEFTRGYRAGREWYFLDASPDERRRTDSDIMHYLRDTIADLLHTSNGEVAWNYSVGCLIGELSGQLFPCTQQEIQEWEEAHRNLLEYEQHIVIVEHQFLHQSQQV